MTVKQREAGISRNKTDLLVAADHDNILDDAERRITRSQLNNHMTGGDPARSSIHPRHREFLEEPGIMQYLGSTHDD